MNVLRRYAVTASWRNGRDNVTYKCLQDEIKQFGTAFFIRYQNFLLLIGAWFVFHGASTSSESPRPNYDVTILFVTGFTNDGDSITDDG